MLIKGWEAKKVKAEQDKAETERKRSAASTSRGGRQPYRRPL